MRNYGVLKDDQLYEAFCAVDRGLFAYGISPDITNRAEAYKDHPFRDGAIHISAPHMYVSILEALNLHKNGLSFLNVGSGSGYLSCLVSHIAGDRALCHGIDISEAAVEHAQKCTAEWQMRRRQKESATSLAMEDERSVTRRFSVDSSPPYENITYITGNCFNLDPESIVMKYDRIYVGAGCPENRWHIFRQFLAPDGILILPIDDTNQLSRVQMNSDSEFVLTALSAVRFQSLVGTDDNYHFPAPVVENHNEDSEEEEESSVAMETDVNEADESEDILDQPQPGSGAEEATQEAQPAATKQYPVLSVPKLLEWTPFTHRYFPRSFHNAMSTILFSRHRARVRLPLHVWMYVFTFLRRDWFVPQLTQEDLLRRDLEEERKARRAAEATQQSTEMLLLRAARDRDSYRASLRSLHQAASESLRAHGTSLMRQGSAADRHLLSILLRQRLLHRLNGASLHDLEMDASASESEGDGSSIEDEEDEEEEDIDEEEEEEEEDMEEEGDHVWEPNYLFHSWAQMTSVGLHVPGAQQSESSSAASSETDSSPASLTESTSPDAESSPAADPQT